MSAQAFVAELGATLASGYRVVVVETPEEGRARELLARIFGDELHTWSVSSGLAGDATLRAPVEALRQAAARAGIFVFCDLSPHLADPEVARALRECAILPRAHEGRGAVLVLGSSFELPRSLERDVAIVELGLPDALELGALFDVAVMERPHAATWAKTEFVRAALGLTHDEAARAFKRAIRHEEPDTALARVIAEKKRGLRRSATLELLAEEVALGDVGGLDVLKQWLTQRVLAFDEGARAFGLPEPRGMLVCGVQGCGKSLVSKAAARVLGLPLVRLDFADVFAARSPEQAIRETIRAVEAVSPVVLWVDEIEKGFGDGGDARQVRVFGAFLTWLQERRRAVFVAATANEVERLPPELARRGRFDEVFFVDLPGAAERQEILSLHLERRGRDPALFPLPVLAKELEHFSGAELETLVTSALFRAYAARRELTDADLKVAAKEIVPLAVLYEEKVQALRTWGSARARRASADRRTLELFRQ